MIVRALLLTVAAAVVVSNGPVLQAQAAKGKAALINPAEVKATSPATYKVQFDTTKGPFVVEVHRDWAPLGADHFYALVSRGYYDGLRFIRVTPGFTVQWGTHGDPDISKAWLRARITDDPQAGHKNMKGSIAFASPAMNRRSTELMINLADNPSFDLQIRPIGEIVSGMNIVEKLYSGYGDWAPTGQGPDRNRYLAEGNPYLEKDFPMLDYVKAATIVQ